MKKRITAVVLGAAMVLGIATSALAAGDPVASPYKEADIMPISTGVDIGGSETNDAALARVTLAVKSVLGIGDEYTEFSGSSSKTGALTFWDLDWSSEDGSINVTANDAGKVFSYRYYDSSSDVPYYGSFSPAIPKNTREAALEAAKEFVAPLLGDIETIRWDAREGIRELGATNYYFSGTICLNGLTSPISISVSVRASDLAVIRFNRSDASMLMLPDVPSPDAPASAEDAAKLLRGAYTLELQYVMDDKGKNPVLRYVLADEKNLLVDAKTGELIDVEALMQDIYERGGNVNSDMAAAEAAFDKNMMATGASLSDVEKQAIAKLEGVKSIDELEKDARAIKALGLDDKFSLTSSDYSRVSYTDPEAREKDAEDVTEVYVTLRFVRDRRASGNEGDVIREGDIIRTSKTVRLNAKTGEFVNVSGYTSEPVTMDAKTLVNNANAFAEAHAEHFDEYKLYDNEERSFYINLDAAAKTEGEEEAPTSFNYYRNANNVPFKQDAIRVRVDGSDGSILSFSYSYTDDLTFPSTEGIVDMEAAIDAYFGAHTVKLGYAELPVEVTPTDIVPLRAEFAKAGYSYIYELRLIYGAEREEGWLRGVDAVTGEAIIEKSEPRTGITYEDVDLSYAADIAKELGEYGVGYRGGKLNPTASLTQLDMLTLFMSANHHEVADEPTEEDIDWMYSVAEGMGIKIEKRDPSAAVTRAEYVRTLVSTTEYGVTAKLENIWAPGFTDDASIAPGDAGAIAIARALGMVQGDTDGGFHPADAITRQDALIVLYNYMTR